MAVLSDCVRNRKIIRTQEGERSLTPSLMEASPLTITQLAALAEKAASIAKAAFVHGYSMLK